MKKDQTPDGFVLREIHVDLEVGIRTAVEEVFGNTKILYCVWHMRRAWDRELGNRSKYPTLTLETMKRDFSKLYKMIHSLVHVPLHCDEKREHCRELILEELHRKKTTSKVWKEVESYVMDYIFALYLNNSGLFNYKFWAKTSGSCAEPFITTSSSESINKKIKANMPKAAVYENQVRAIQKVMKDTYRNFLWQKNNDSRTKRKKRFAIVRNILLGSIFNQMQSIKFLNQSTFDPDDQAYYNFTCLFNFIPKVDTYAEKVVEGKNELFQSWLSFHSYHFPEDKQILSYLIDENAKLPVNVQTTTFGEMITKIVPKKKKKSTQKPDSKSKKKPKPDKKKPGNHLPIPDIYQICNSTLLDKENVQSNVTEVIFKLSFSFYARNFIGRLPLADTQS